MFRFTPVSRCPKSFARAKASRSHSNTNVTASLHTVALVPVFKNLDGSARWMIGVSPDVKWHIQKTSLSFPAALQESLRQNRKYGTLIVDLLGGIIERRMPAKNLRGRSASRSRPRQAAQDGPAAFLTLMSLVSLNLAILNLLPIPILDGAMILTLLIEMVMGRDISLNVKEAMLKLGFIFLMMLMVFVLYNDIARRITPGLLVSHRALPYKASGLLKR